MLTTSMLHVMALDSVSALHFRLTNCEEGFRHGRAMLVDGFAGILPHMAWSHVPNAQGARPCLRCGEIGGGLCNGAARHCLRRFLRVWMKHLGGVAGNEASAVIPTDHGNG